MRAATTTTKRYFLWKILLRFIHIVLLVHTVYGFSIFPILVIWYDRTGYSTFRFDVDFSDLILGLVIVKKHLISGFYPTSCVYMRVIVLNLVCLSAPLPILCCYSWKRCWPAQIRCLSEENMPEALEGQTQHTMKTNENSIHDISQILHVHSLRDH